MLLLLDIGNTHTHVGLANDRRILRQANLPTHHLATVKFSQQLARFLGNSCLTGAGLCSVVPKATPKVRQLLWREARLRCFELTHQTVTGIGIDYPLPHTIGADRLANAIAARERFGAPVVVVDFGTAVTFDVVNKSGDYAGGIIAPGLSAMTDYLHEKTALLPRVTLRDTSQIIGKSTKQAMLIGAVHGYRGLITGLLTGLRKEMKVRRLPVVATGGCARLIAAKLPGITAVDPGLTLEGLRLAMARSKAG